jgi:hypothetical protein
MSTFFALTRLPKEQLKGTDNPRKLREAQQTAAAPSEPLYRTEHEVRVALLNQEIGKDGFYPALEAAKAWEKYQKEQERQRFFRKSKAKVNPKRYTHVFSFGG